MHSQWFWQGRNAIRFEETLKTMVQDEFSESSLPKKVFCSQSVLLMLRNCLDPSGIHGGLVDSLKPLNSRLTSPKMVNDRLLAHPFTYDISNRELRMLGACLAPAPSAR
jgi:hypothetical protein